MKSKTITIILILILSSCSISQEYADTVKMYADLIVPKHILYIINDNSLTTAEKEVIVKSLQEFHKMSKQYSSKE